MSTISLRMQQEDYDLLNEYVKMNKLNLSAFVREAIMDKIEESYLNEEKILEAWKEAKEGPLYSADEVWQNLGL